MQDVLGWTSSLVLVATILSQITKQWQERSVKGVSTWLFIGQSVASLGFTIYSYMVENWVFTATNALMLVSAIVGWVMTAHFKRRPDHSNTPRVFDANDRLSNGTTL